MSAVDEPAFQHVRSSGMHAPVWVLLGTRPFRYAVPIAILYFAPRSEAISLSGGHPVTPGEFLSGNWTR